MAVLGWLMMGLAIWHFTIFLPDRFWGGIAGACFGACIGAVICGLLINGVGVPTRADTDIPTILEAIPGTLIGLVALYFEGIRRESAVA